VSSLNPVPDPDVPAKARRARDGKRLRRHSARDLPCREIGKPSPLAASTRLRTPAALTIGPAPVGLQSWLEPGGVSVQLKQRSFPPFARMASD
jgi:hypothetical protein